MKIFRVFTIACVPGLLGTIACGADVGDEQPDSEEVSVSSPGTEPMMTPQEFCSQYCVYKCYPSATIGDPSRCGSSCYTYQCFETCYLACMS